MQFASFEFGQEIVDVSDRMVLVELSVNARSYDFEIEKLLDYVE